MNQVLRAGRKLWMLSSVLALGPAMGCDVPPEPDASLRAGTTVTTPVPVSGVTTTSHPVLGPEVWVSAALSVSSSEPFAFALRANNTWQLVNSFNTIFNDGFMRYSCTRDNGATWVNHGLNLGSNSFGGDTSGFFRSGGGDPANIVALATNGSTTNGIRWFSSPDPCPATGAANWSWVTPTLGGIDQIDYPYAVYNPNNDQRWVTWNARHTGNNQTTIWVGNLANNGVFSWTGLFCPGDTGAKQFANSAFDSNNNLHIVYRDNGLAAIRHVIFNTSTFSFDCSSLSTVSSHSFQPNNSCSTACGTTPTLAGTSCLRDTFNASISIDRASSPNNLVVTFGNRGSGACNNQTETNFYRSTNLGASWTQTGVTGCTTSVQPRVEAAFTPTQTAVANRFHVMSTYRTTGATFRQVDWKSTDGGASWSGTFMTTSRTVNPISGCYWGDYNGVAPDIANNRYYYNFGQLETSVWRIRAVTNDI